ncbi:Uncharacterized protein dnm_057040 [Desulfonema magnum]|uniref:Uncharacterized protein n=1 Tax=Desulfonema magnum TaxID=45655 RepID=A0A975BQ55_9BACT|nr:Uncharacterized protein dnm_057040 [Desulfonema magnum]
MPVTVKFSDDGNHIAHCEAVRATAVGDTPVKGRGKSPRGDH